MSTVAGRCGPCVGANRHTLRVGCTRLFFASLVCASLWFGIPCQAQSAAPQNAAPPATADDPPPSLIKHPKPAATPPPQPTTTQAPGSSSTPAPAEQAPAAQSGTTQGSAGRSGASAPPSAAPNSAPAQSGASVIFVAPASTSPGADSSTGAAQPANEVQASPVSPSTMPEATLAPVATPASTTLASAPADSVASTPEINTRTATVPLESHANLVPVRVVVHDGNGHAVENLQRDDFQIKQDGKLQFITHFSVETPGGAERQVARGEAIPLPTDSTSYAISNSAVDASGRPGPAPPGALAMPSRFVALLFDDAHLDIGDLAQSKVAALRFIETSVKPNQRLAVYTVSGHHEVDFTDDQEKIRAAISALIANPVGAYDPSTQHDCLQISYYQTDLIQNKNDQQAAAVANADAQVCAAAATGGQGVQQQAAMLVTYTVQED